MVVHLLRLDDPEQQSCQARLVVLVAGMIGANLLSGRIEGHFKGPFICHCFVLRMHQGLYVGAALPPLTKSDRRC